MKQKYPLTTSIDLAMKNSPSRSFICNRGALITNVISGILLVFLTVFCNKINAQTTLLSPTGDGGFETGTTLALNNWSADTPAQTNRNQWTCGTGATAGFSGTRAAYVSNDVSLATPPHTYLMGTTRVSHFYRNITVPAGQTNITLSFNWMGRGEATYDKMRVWLVPTSYTPVYDTQITASGTAPTGNIAVGLTDYDSQNTWTASGNITIPTAYAGTTFRLVFEWVNDGSGGTSPPAAIDYISLISASCAAVNIPYAQDFESVTTPAIPNCNSIQNAGTGNNWFTASNPGYGFTSKTLQYTYHASNVANAWYYTQGLNLTGGTTYRISYRYGSTGATFPENLKVAYGNTAAAASMTTVLATHNSISTTNNSNFVDFTPGTTGVYYMGFNAFSTANQFYLFVDDITVTLPPAPCAAPSQANTFVLGTVTSSSIAAGFSGTATGYLVIQSTSTVPTQPVNGTTYSAANVSGLGAGLTFIQSSASTSISSTGLAGNTKYNYYIYAYNSGSCSGGPVYSALTTLTGSGTTCPAIPNSVSTASVTGNSFTLNWAAPTGGSASPIAYALQVTTDAGYLANVGSSPYSLSAPTATLNITGLSANTVYYYRILANTTCSSAYVSSSVSTACVATNIPYTQNFESVTTPAIPNCNSIQNTGTGNDWFTANNPGYGFTSKTLQYTYNSSNPGSAWFFTQGLNLTAGVSYRITYRYGSTGATFPENLKVAYGNSAAAASMTTVLATHNSISTTNNSNFVDFVPAATGVYYMGFNAFSVANQFYLFADDITVTLSPNCLPPPVNTAISTSTTSATISWNVPAIVPANGYQYVVSTSNVTPAGAGTATASLTANVTGLTVNTTYYVFVRSDCGAGNFSSWSSSINFYTGYCSVNGIYSSDYINNFSTTGGITNITNNSSGFSAGGYGNFTALSVSQQPYGTVNFSSAYVGGTYGFNIWVDWNDDLDFDDSGEKVYGSGNFNSSNTGSFIVPATASVGSHRMRILANYLDSNPLACGAIDDGEAEDYTFTVVALACSGNPTNLPATSIGFTTATINWNAAAPVPANGYEYYYSTSGTVPVYATAPSGSTATGILTANLTGLSSGTAYYVWVRSNCGANKGVWVGPLSFITNAAPPVTTNASVCPGGSGTLTATGTCTGLSNLGNTINGAWDAGSDPRAIRPYIFIANSTTCQFDTSGLTSNYTSLDFQVSTTGFYTFTMPNTTAYDAMGYIVINPFTPGVCGSGTWIVGDDDSGATTFEPLMSSTLTAGITYTLITTLYSGSNITLTNTYQWDITGPGTISGVTGGTVEWYLAASGGTPIGTGTPFNPVGVSGSGLTNSNTPGTYTYYAACPNNPNVRTAANFVINGPTGVISGTGTTCGGASTPISITLTGTSPWNFTYTDGTTPVTVTGNTTNPYVFTVAPSVPTNYTLTALSDANCTATAANMTGTATITASKTWNGGTNTDWSVATNWTPNGVPTATDCVVIPNTINDPIIAVGSYNGYAYNLTILNGGILQVNGTNSITVTDVVTVIAGGQFLIKNAASLVQINNVANSGIINVERITQPMYRFDYTYWGCPVTFASNFTLGNLSPETLPDKYFSWTPTVSNSFGTWFFETSATVMNPIKGYIARAPQTFSGSPATKVPYTGNFIGVPNNGNILCPIYHGTLGVGNNNDKYNLLGNPYPSAVNAQSFLTDPVNTPIIDGTIYFWTHNSAPSTSYVDPFYGDFVINYTSSDYASWNSLGAVGSRGSAALSGGVVPNGFIASGQGFFTKSTGTAPSGNTVIFKNSMRVTGNNNQFFRQTSDVVEKSRVWLNMINDGGSFNQILVGYAQGATNDWDRNYDGVRFTDNSSVSFYSVIPGRDLVIQGRPLPFNEADEVPLGFKTTVADNFSIRIDRYDGIFEEQSIYIEDKLLHKIQDLKTSPYFFTSGIGTFNDRFVLRYVNFSSVNKANSDNAKVTAMIHQKNLMVEASQNIESIEVYDIAGKLIQTYILENKSTKFIENFNHAQGVYVAKIKLKNGFLSIKKLIH